MSVQQESNDTKFVWHVATGGITHMLKLLASSLDFCFAEAATLFPLTENHQAFGLPFDSIFDISRSTIINCSPEKMHMAAMKWKGGMNLPTSPLNAATSYVSGSGEERGYYILKGLPSFRGETRYLEKMLCRDEKSYLTTGTSDASWECLTRLLCQIRLVAEIGEAALEAHAALSKPYIACHFRNTDYRTDFSGFVSEIRSMCDEKSIYNIYIATDDLGSIPKFIDHLPNIKVNYNSTLKFDVRGSKERNLHYVSAEKLREVGSSKFEQHSIFFTDILILALGALYIPSKLSSVKHLIWQFQQYPELLDWFYSAPREIMPPAESALKFSRKLRLAKTRLAAAIDRVNKNNSDDAPSEFRGNLAHGKFFSQSSFYRGIITDGILKKNEPFFFHTEDENCPWLIIDLAVIAIIKRIVIYNRTNGYQNRASGLFVELIDDLDFPNLHSIFEVPTDADFTNGTKNYIEIKPPVDDPCRYVVISSRNKTFLHFSNIEVFGTEADKLGDLSS